MCMCGFCDVWMCGFCNVWLCVDVLVICVLVLTVFFNCFIYVIYSYLLLVQGLLPPSEN